MALSAWVTEGLGLNLKNEAAAIIIIIIIDGKVLRDTRSDHTRTMRILLALDQHTGRVLSKAQTDADTNEAKTALTFLKGFVLKGKTVVGDVAFCQRDICEQV